MSGNLPDRYAAAALIKSTPFSDVVLCRERNSKRRLAAKIFMADLRLGDSEGGDRIEIWRQRFIREGSLLASLRHPHIVPILDEGVCDDGRPFFVMPFIESNLVYEIGQDRIESEPPELGDDPWRPKRLCVARVMRIMGQLLDALACLHRKGLAHRDLKPDNILVTKASNGDVRLCDFGMVKYPDWSVSLSGAGIGTLNYAAPEQREGATDIDSRTDVYGLGAIAYRMLTGSLPLGAFPAPNIQVPDVPEPLGGLIMRCLSRERKNRPRDAMALQDELSAAVSCMRAHQ